MSSGLVGESCVTDRRLLKALGQLGCLIAATDNNQTLDDSVGPYPPPHALENQAQEATLTQAMIEIGVINRTADGRLNMPDLFRVAAGIGRRGGVRAIR